MNEFENNLSSNNTENDDITILTEEILQQEETAQNASTIENVEENIENDTFITIEETEEQSETQNSINEEKINQEQPTQNAFTFESDPTSNENKTNKPKRSGSKKMKNSTVMATCFALAFVGALGGTYCANLITGKNNTVVYKTPTTTSAKGTSAKKDGNALSVNQVAETCADSVVEIKTESISTNSFFSQAVTSGAGSGVILSKDGYIVTNHHVISGANKVTVTTKSGKTYDAKLIGSDQSSDLAVIKVEANDLKPAVLGSSKALQVGDSAIAIGNPLGELGGTVTNGIISALDREITVDNQTMHLLQTNAAINPGNSGGGLFNDQGELIGIVNAKSSGDNIEGLGFAIPIDRAQKVIENLIENGYVKGRAALGVSLKQATSPFSSDEASIYIASLEEGKAAANAGLKVGDQILKMDGKEITSVTQIKDILNEHKAGDTIDMSVLRDQEVQTFKVTLSEAPQTTQQTSQQQQENPNNEQDIDDFFEDPFSFFGE